MKSIAKLTEHKQDYSIAQNRQKNIVFMRCRLFFHHRVLGL